MFVTNFTIASEGETDYQEVPHYYKEIEQCGITENYYLDLDLDHLYQYN